jgi:hypothetical protein
LVGLVLDLVLAGVDPTIVSYNSSSVKFTAPRVAYIVRFENKNVFFYNEKCLFNAGVEVVNSKVVGLDPGFLG